VHKKSAEDATRRLLKVARDHEKAAAEVTQLRLLVSEAERQQADLSAQIAAIHASRRHSGRPRPVLH
jgi:hypothetical protein